MTAWERHIAGTVWHAAQPSRIYLTGPYDPTPAIKYSQSATVESSKEPFACAALNAASTLPRHQTPEGNRSEHVDAISQYSVERDHQSMVDNLFFNRSLHARRGRVRGATFVVK